MGKRYGCGSCAAEVVVTKAGDGSLECHGQPMTQK
ncbi:MAG: desulfoferrodoxin [Dehalococcoidia bacterium]|nr:desulfoferrodoxin [Dehalococcoidia bacterium]